jgi:hypothetical protein
MSERKVSEAANSIPFPIRVGIAVLLAMGMLFLIMAVILWIH